MVSKQYGVCVCVFAHFIGHKNIKKKKHFSSRMLRGKHKKNIKRTHTTDIIYLQIKDTYTF